MWFLKGAEGRFIYETWTALEQLLCFPQCRDAQYPAQDYGLWAEFTRMMLKLNSHFLKLTSWGFYLYKSLTIMRVNAALGKYRPWFFPDT